jgi:hypothetical protein
LFSNSNLARQENGTLLNLSTGSSNGISSPPFSTSLAQPPPVPPRAFEVGSCSKPFGENDFIGDMLSSSAQPSVGTKLEGLLLDELEEDFNPRAYEQMPSNNNNSSSSNGSVTSPPLCEYRTLLVSDPSEDYSVLLTYSLSSRADTFLESGTFSETALNLLEGL